MTLMGRWSFLKFINLPQWGQLSSLIPECSFCLKLALLMLATPSQAPAHISRSGSPLPARIYVPVEGRSLRLIMQVNTCKSYIRQMALEEILNNSFGATYGLIWD